MSINVFGTSQQHEQLLCPIQNAYDEAMYSGARKDCTWPFERRLCAKTRLVLANEPSYGHKTLHADGDVCNARN